MYRDTFSQLPVSGYCDYFDSYMYILNIYCDVMWHQIDAALFQSSSWSNFAECIRSYNNWLGLRAILIILAPEERNTVRREAEGQMFVPRGLMYLLLPKNTVNICFVTWRNKPKIYKWFENRTLWLSLLNVRLKNLIQRKVY